MRELCFSFGCRVGAVRSDLEHVLRCSLKSCLFFKTHRELHPPCKRKPSLTTCPKQSPFPLKYYIVESCTLEPFFLWAAALLHKNEKGQRASERCGEAVGFRLRRVWEPPPAVGRTGQGGGYRHESPQLWTGGRVTELTLGRVIQGLFSVSPSCFIKVKISWLFSS